MSKHLSWYSVVMFFPLHFISKEIVLGTHLYLLVLFPENSSVSF